VAIPIDHDQAKQILFEESEAANTLQLPPIATNWRALVTKLGDLCPHGKSSTVIAALGTALLAKSVDNRVDVYSLLDRGESPTSYSARSLADGVWARNRAKLQIDLGANGTNPLNNTPFIGKTRIDDITGVRNQEGWSHFIECMERLKALDDSKSARLALRGFIAARRRQLLPTLSIDPQLGDNLNMRSLIELIEEYVEADSEGGRRAQACVAGTLDSVFGANNVIVGVINDPDRRAPLDVSVKDAGGAFVHAFEVKDKPISDSHLYASIEKTVADHAVKNLVFLGFSSQQNQKDFTEAETWASEHGVKITVILDWVTFLTACRCFAPPSNDIFEGRVLRAILARAADLGVRRSDLQSLVQRSAG